MSVFYYRASGRKMEKFSVSVNIAAKSNVTFVLTYEELLQRKLGQYEILTRVKPKQPVQEFKVTPNSCTSPQGSCWFQQDLQNEWFSLINDLVSVCFSPVWRQIVTNIYEPQGIAFVNTHANFLTNELLPLVEKTVTDKKVHDRTGLVRSCFWFSASLAVSKSQPFLDFWMCSLSHLLFLQIQ